MRRVAAWVFGCAVAVACNPYTSRPPISPMLGALAIEVEREVPAATASLAEALRADSLPIETISLVDGYVESPWFEGDPGVPTARRPLGPDVVRLRAWVDPEQPGHARITVEIVYRRWADPSLPERELEQLVPPDHPTSRRVQATLTRLGGQPVGGAP